MLQSPSLWPYILVLCANWLSFEQSSSYCLHYLITFCADNRWRKCMCVMMSYNRQKVVSRGGTWHRPVLSIKKDVLVLLCKCCGFKIRVWMGIVVRARSTSAKRNWGSVELCINKPYLLHCTVWSNHGAVPWHMTHYSILRVWKTMTKDPRNPPHYCRRY